LQRAELLINRAADRSTSSTVIGKGLGISGFHGHGNLGSGRLNLTPCPVIRLPRVCEAGGGGSTRGAAAPAAGAPPAGGPWTRGRSGGRDHAGRRGSGKAMGVLGAGFWLKAVLACGHFCAG